MIKKSGVTFLETDNSLILRIHIKCVKYSLEDRSLGAARVGQSRVNRDHYTIENLEIHLNSELIHEHLKKSGEASDSDIWVNVIAHEVAHNLGYTHGSRGQWSQDYPGYFPTEIGFCAMTGGQKGSSSK